MAKQLEIKAGDRVRAEGKPGSFRGVVVGKAISVQQAPSGTLVRIEDDLSFKRDRDTDRMLWVDTHQWDIEVLP